jgi:signal transduction histidine kinase
LHSTASAAPANPGANSLRYAWQIAVIALLYIIAARVGLQIEAISGFAALVWPPTGIAFAALLLGGYRLWPGIFLGAVIANVWTGAPIPVALGIGLGNTLEAVVGVYALKRLPDFRFSLDRVRDAIGFIVLAAALATLVSATIGVLSLYLGGIVPRGQLAETWRAWWLGDAIGALLVAPLVLVWSARPVPVPTASRLLEASALTISVTITSLFIFVAPGARDGGLLNQAYIFFPFLIWAAIRFGQYGAVATTFLVSVIAVWGTALGHGPFADDTLHGSLFALQTFMGLTAATFLVLGASTSERKRADIELRTAHDVAAKANRAKAEFLAVMSHELRTPLNAIAGYSELLSVGVAGPLSDKQAEAVARIRRNQQHLLGLINDVLTFARFEAGSSTIQPVPMRVCEALDAIEPLIQPSLSNKGLQLLRDSCDPALEVQADPTKLNQILLNIVGNAIKFTPSGGRIGLGASGDGDTVTITVTDTGIGVPDDKVTQIFEPFFQVHTGTTREYSGVGLGLAIARDLAHEMGGDIHFASAPGKGSAVSLILPTPTAV